MTGLYPDRNIPKVPTLADYQPGDRVTYFATSPALTAWAKRVGVGIVAKVTSKRVVVQWPRSAHFTGRTCSYQPYSLRKAPPQEVPAQ